MDWSRAARVADDGLAQIDPAQACDIAGSAVGLAIEGCRVAAHADGWSGLLNGDRGGGRGCGVGQVAAINRCDGVCAGVHGGRAAAVIDPGRSQNAVVRAEHVGRNTVGQAVVGHRQGAQGERRLGGARRVVHDLDRAGPGHRRIVLAACERGGDGVCTGIDRSLAIGRAVGNNGRTEIRTVQAGHPGRGRVRRAIIRHDDGCDVDRRSGLSDCQGGDG